MKTQLLAVCLSLVIGTLGCAGPEGPAGPPGEAGPPGAKGDPGEPGEGGDVVGARLRPLMLEAEDGSRIKVGWYDEELDEECEIIRMTTGKAYCVPLTIKRDVSTYTEGCEKPLVAGNFFTGPFVDIGRTGIWEANGTKFVGTCGVIQGGFCGFSNVTCTDASPCQEVDDATAAFAGGPVN